MILTQLLAMDTMDTMEGMGMIMDMEDMDIMDMAVVDMAKFCVIIAFINLISCNYLKACDIIIALITPSETCSTSSPSQLRLNLQLNLTKVMSDKVTLWNPPTESLTHTSNQLNKQNRLNWFKKKRSLN